MTKIYFKLGLVGFWFFAGIIFERFLIAPQFSQPQTSVQKCVQASARMAEIKNCHDGDTCRVRLRENELKEGETKNQEISFNVRLAGIDAPEVRNHKTGLGAQSFGQEAQSFLQGRIAGKGVLLRQYGTDPYNRPLVEIFLGDTNVNLELVQMGFAEVYLGATGGIDLKPYVTAETQAKQRKIGMWAQGEDYISPGSFRHQRRAKR